MMANPNPFHLQKTFGGDILSRVPREIWEMILLQLPYYEDLVMASLSCKLWRSILADHLVCPTACYVVAHGWKVEKPFLYNFLPGTPPNEKEEFPLERAINNWVTWPHIPLCFEVILRDRNERRPRLRSRAHYGLDIRWAFKGFIPYTDKERRMDLENRSHSQFPPTTSLANNEERASNALATVESPKDRGKGEMMETESTTADGEREPKRARALDGWLRGNQAQSGPEPRAAEDSHASTSPDEAHMVDVDFERHIVKADTTDENNAGHFTFYCKPLFMMHGEQLKEFVASLVDEARRERRNEVPMFGLIVERAKRAGSERSRGDANDAILSSMMDEGEWRCIRERRKDCNGSTSPESSVRAKHAHRGKSYMAGFYIPHMDKYAYGTDTLVFELEIKLGGAHIPSSPFLLSFFNPLLP